MSPTPRDPMASYPPPLLPRPDLGGFHSGPPHAPPFHPGPFPGHFPGLGPTNSFSTPSGELK